MRDSKEKASELIDKFLDCAWAEGDDFAKSLRENAAKCALICVDELSAQAEETFHAYGIGYMGSAIARNDYSKSMTYKFWQDVKGEIKLTAKIN